MIALIRRPGPREPGDRVPPGIGRDDLAAEVAARVGVVVVLEQEGAVRARPAAEAQVALGDQDQVAV